MARPCLNQIAHECLSFIKANFGFFKHGQLKPRVLCEMMSDPDLMSEGMRSFTHRYTFSEANFLLLCFRFVVIFYYALVTLLIERLSFLMDLVKSRQTCIKGKRRAK